MKQFIRNQKDKYNGIDFEIIIDGRVAIEDNAQLSYLRAYSLYLLWKENKLFDNKKDHIHAAGSSNEGMGMSGNGSDRTFKIIVIPFIKNSKTQKK